MAFLGLFGAKTECLLCSSKTKMPRKSMKLCGRHAKNHELVFFREPNGKEYAVVALDPNVK